MKLIAIFIVLVAVATVVSGQTTGSMATTDGLYTFTWVIMGNQITGTIVVTTAANTWAAVGFSDEQLMPMSDVVIGGNDGTNSFVEDRWITDGRTPANVVYDTSQDITVTSATRVSGVLTITFTRPLNTNNATQEVSLENRCVWVLWAYGGTVGDFTTSPVTGLTGHLARSIFPEQLCSDNAITRPTLTPTDTVIISTIVVVLVILLVGLGLVIVVFGNSLCLTMIYMKKRSPLREEVIANTDIAQNNLSYKPIGSQWMNLEDNLS